MAEITLSSAVRSNLLSLQGTAKLLDKTQNRLATGLKVSSAIDNPQSFFTAQGLNNRAADLNTLLDSQGLAVQTLKAADEGIKSLTKLVEQAKSTANQALNTKIAASFKESTFTVSSAAATAFTAFGSASADVLSIQVGTATAVTVKLSNQTITELVSNINGQTGISAEITADNKIKISGDSGRQLTITSTTGSVSADIGVGGTFDNGTNRDSFVTDFNTVRTQIDQLASDASFNGVNLLNGNDLTVIFNESQTSSLTISGVTYNSSGLGITAATNSEFETDANITAKINLVDSATSKLRKQASTFGGNLSIVQNRQDFTQNLINTLETGAAGLTLADTNEEGANLLALQTRQQLGSVALSLASQADQNVLRLF